MSCMGVAGAVSCLYSCHAVRLGWCVLLTDVIPSHPVLTGQGSAAALEFCFDTAGAYVTKGEISPSAPKLQGKQDGKGLLGDATARCGKLL